MIQVEHLTKTFRIPKKKRGAKESSDINAVNQVSFRCEPGRVFSLLGPNGAGKTTTLRMIAGIIKPSSGEALICNLNTTDNQFEVQKKIGYLTGSTGLYERLNPVETMQFLGKVYGLTPDLIQKRMNDLFELLGIHEFKKKLIGQLSTGMKQKVSIARTLLHDPDVLIFDEPTSGLDVITAASIIDLIRSAKENNKTVIFSSHTMSEVDLLCDDLAIINKGEIIYNGTYADFKQEMNADSLTQEFINRVKEA